MALEYGFYDSIGGDRKYNNEQMSAIFDGIINDGVYEQIGDHFAVKPSSGMRITIGTGRAWKEHTWSWNSSLYPMTIATADPIFARLDTVYLKIDKREEERRNSFYIMRGNPMYGNPSATVPPVQTDVYWIPLAYVTVRAATTSITQADIENLVGKDPRAPFVTGPLKTASIEDLFSQWEGQFNEWFYEVQTDLSGDVAANLLARINERVKIADKATDADIDKGTDANKWVSVAGVNRYFMTARRATDAEAAAMEVDNKWVSPKQIRMIGKPVLHSQVYDKAGTYTFRVPKNIWRNCFTKVWIIGGGQSGYAADWNYYRDYPINSDDSYNTPNPSSDIIPAVGGVSLFKKVANSQGKLGDILYLTEFQVTPNASITITVGKGGAPTAPVVSGDYTSPVLSTAPKQGNGGISSIKHTSSFGTIQAYGGGYGASYAKSSSRMKYTKPQHPLVGSSLRWEDLDLASLTEKKTIPDTCPLIPPEPSKIFAGASGSGSFGTGESGLVWNQTNEPGSGSDGYVYFEYYLLEVIE